MQRMSVQLLQVPMQLPSPAAQLLLLLLLCAAELAAGGSTLVLASSSTFGLTAKPSHMSAA